MKKKSLKKKIFEYIIIAVVLLIPFIYSFFYLKAYWNPYGKGNMNNLPVAIVNNDKGTNGKELVEELVNAKKLNLTITTEEKAEDGLNQKDYYAIISIPEDFSESIESISTTNKKHPTITYSPNQKSNYLASQIIDRVVSTVESNLDNKINSEIISNLSNNLEEVPNSIEQISDGLNTMENGIEKLHSGSNKLNDGSNTLNNKYNQFHNGLKDIKLGADTLHNSMEQLNDGINTIENSKTELNTLKESIPTLVGSVNTITASSNQFTEGLNQYIAGVNGTMDYTTLAAEYIVQSYNAQGLTPDELYYKSLYMITNNDQTGNTTPTNYIKASGETLKNGNIQFNQGVNALNEKVCLMQDTPQKVETLVSGIERIKNGSNQITQGSNTLKNGIDTLYMNSSLIQNGISSISSGNNELNNGFITLNTGVNNSIAELNKKTTDTKKDLESLNNLKEYSKEPVTIKKKEVNKVTSYGTAFAPLFISIGLWIGALMMYIVFYFDKEERFGILGINSKNHMARTLAYHGLATIEGIILGILLHILLDFNISNIALYYFLMILVANTFLAIMEFLITNFKDIGKFIALILLVLQLAASGGTFPIETVNKGFRFLHPFLPMTYTINVWKEPLVTIERSLLSKNMIVIAGIFIILCIINFTISFIKTKKAK